MIRKISCPFCCTGMATVTYEENRIYKCECKECGNTILHKDTSWDNAYRFFLGGLYTDVSYHTGGLRDLLCCDRICQDAAILLERAIGDWNK